MTSAQVLDIFSLRKIKLLRRQNAHRHFICPRVWQLFWSVLESPKHSNVNRAMDCPGLLITNTDATVHASATSSLPGRFCEGRAMCQMATEGCLTPSRVEKGLEMSQSKPVSQSHLPPLLNLALEVSENCISRANTGESQGLGCSGYYMAGKWNLKTASLFLSPSPNLKTKKPVCMSRSIVSCCILVSPFPNPSIRRWQDWVLVPFSSLLASREDITS